MNDRVRTSISRLIDDMSTPQDDSEKDGAIWKPSATKLAEMEQKYACADPGSVKDSCRPWNYQDYLDRLATFRDSSRWFATPAGLSPLQCALLGWSCDTSRRDGLICLCCKATLVHDNTGDAKGEVLQAQLASGHAKECGWGHSGKSSGPDQGPTACPASFMDVPGVQSAAKLSEQVVGRVNSLLAMMLAAAVSGAQTAAQVSISLRELIPGQGGGRSASLPLDVSETELAALKAHFQELEGRMTTSPSRSGSNRTAWANCKGADLIRSAVAWLLDSDAATQAPGAADSADEKSAQLIRALLAIALSGWTASCSVQNARAVCCHLCGRAVSLSTADLEPLSQHRYFCPVVNRQSEVPLWLTVSTEGKNSVKKAGESQGAAQGWECTLRAVIATFLSSNAADISRDRRQSLEKESTVPTQGAAQVASPAQKHTLSVDTAGGTASSSVVNDGSAGVSVSEGEGSEVSPEQAYKRIRTVLALAAASKI